LREIRLQGVNPQGSKLALGLAKPAGEFSRGTGNNTLFWGV